MLSSLFPYICFISGVEYLFKSKYWADVCLRNLNKFYTICCMCFSCLFVCSLFFFFICTGDSERNPGARKKQYLYNLSFCYWNLNSIAAHNFSKLSLLEAYDIPRKLDMICLSETLLDSSIPSNYERLYNKAYKLIRADNPSHSKKSSVGIYYKEVLAVCSVEVKSLNECIMFEVYIKKKEDIWSHYHLVKHKMSLTFFC